MSKTKNQSQDKLSLLEMPIIKAMFVLSIPIVITNVLQTMYFLIDAFWVGRLGEEAIAVVTIALSIIMLTTSLGSGLSIAGSILIAQYFGARDDKMVNHVAGQTLLMITVASIVLGAIGFIFTPQMVHMMGATPEIFDDTVAFIRISFVGLLFMFVAFMFQSIMRGIGRPNVPIIVIVVTLVVNFALNPVLIFGYGSFEGLGVRGSAITTVVSQFIATFMALWIMFSGRFGMNLKWRDFVPDMSIIKQSFWLGLPSSIEMTARSGSFTLLTAIVASFGTLALAGYGVAINIIMFCIIFALGLSMATTVLVGQSVGANMIKKAKEINNKSALISLFIMTGVGGLCFIFATPIISIFVPKEPEVIELGAHILRIVSFFFGLIGAQMSYTGVLRAIGKTQIPMYTTLISQWFLKIPTAYVLAYHTFMKEDGIWWADPINSIVLLVVLYIIMTKVDWTKANITKKSHKTPEVVEENVEGQSEIISVTS